MTNRNRLAEGEEIGIGTKAIILSLALLLGFFDHVLGGWGQTAFAAAIAVIAPVIGYRKFWRVRKFWIAAGALAVAQLPLVLMLLSYVRALGFTSVLVFALVDCVGVTFVLAFVCSR